MRIAIIDLGTNTFHLLIAKIDKHQYEILYKNTVAVKLGEGSINQNTLAPAACDRGIQTLKDFKSVMDTYDVSLIKAGATSAIRSAKNGAEFVARAKDEALIEITTITGEEEANAIYEGVKLSGAIQEQALIMDIGGGSVEFILCNPEQVIWKKSYNVGAARLMQHYFKSDPISEVDKNAIILHLQEELTDLFTLCEEHQPTVLIGSAGSFETFAILANQKQPQSIDIETLKTYDFIFEDYRTCSIDLIQSTHAQRSKMEEIIPVRVDMIVMAALITNCVLSKTNIKQLRLSTFDLKMGLLAEEMNKLA
ncbi:Ppx/GppA phosphatase family protein [Pedobacter sp. MW01-1-1]|uniref:Ppx/GppA phosphatase family protein n=1 Tax=Pedobacter sp. MW01-1-1 TaxID=3383027 RepID=UPI003FEEEF2D